MIKARITELDAVLDTLVDGVIMIDGQGNIIRYNPACERIFGHARAEVFGKNISELMPEPYRSGHDGYLKNYQKTAEPQIIGIGREVQGLKKDGTVFPMYLSVGEIAESEETAYVGIIRDLTEVVKRRTEFETLQQQHFHLSRVSAMDQMGATIAHELNQPLTAIMNYLDAGSTMIEREEKVLDTQKLRAVMQKSSEQAARAAAILSRLRKFIETGDVEKKQVSPENIIETSIDLIMPMFKNDGILLIKDIEPNLPNILASHVQIQQVLVNLIKNGCEAMLGGAETSLTVTAHRTHKDIIMLEVPFGNTWLYRHMFS